MNLHSVISGAVLSVFLVGLAQAKSTHHLIGTVSKFTHGENEAFFTFDGIVTYANCSKRSADGQCLESKYQWVESDVRGVPVVVKRFGNEPRTGMTGSFTELCDVLSKRSGTKNKTQMLLFGRIIIQSQGGDIKKIEADVLNVDMEDDDEEVSR